MKKDFRCDCPITSALDIVGDKWSLVIIKQMLLEDRETFKDFRSSDEQIASSILASRLKMLEEWHLISQHKRPDNQKTNIYRLTEKGLGLTPVIMDMALWSDQHIREYHPILRQDDVLQHMQVDRSAVIQTIMDNYRAKLAGDPS